MEDRGRSRAERSPSPQMHWEVLLTEKCALCEHSGDPCAGSRIVHSPEAVQGHTALEEVCEPAPSQPSRFELVAGSAGIRQVSLRSAHVRFPTCSLSDSASFLA